MGNVTSKFTTTVSSKDSKDNHQQISVQCNFFDEQECDTPKEEELEANFINANMLELCVTDRKQFSQEAVQQLVTTVKQHLEIIPDAEFMAYTDEELKMLSEIEALVEVVSLKAEILSKQFNIAGAIRFVTKFIYNKQREDRGQDGSERKHSTLMYSMVGVALVIGILGLVAIVDSAALAAVRLFFTTVAYLNVKCSTNSSTRNEHVKNIIVYIRSRKMECSHSHNGVVFYGIFLQTFHIRNGCCRVHGKWVCLRCKESSLSTSSLRNHARYHKGDDLGDKHIGATNEDKRVLLQDRIVHHTFIDIGNKNRVCYVCGWKIKETPDTLNAILAHASVHLQCSTCFAGNVTSPVVLAQPKSIQEPSSTNETEPEDEPSVENMPAAEAQVQSQQNSSKVTMQNCIVVNGKAGKDITIISEGNSASVGQSQGDGWLRWAGKLLYRLIRPNSTQR